MDSDNNNLDTHISRFEKRAVKLKIQAYLFFLYVIVLFIVAGFVFFYSGFITRIDLGGKSPEQQIEAINKKLKEFDSIKDNNQAIRSNYQKQLQKFIEEKTGGITSEIHSITEKIGEASHEACSPDNSNSVVEVIRRVPSEELGYTGKEHNGVIYLDIGRYRYKFYESGHAASCAYYIRANYGTELEKARKLMAERRALSDSLSKEFAKNSSILEEITQYDDQKESYLKILKRNLKEAIIERDISGFRNATDQKLEIIPLIQLNITRFGTLIILVYLINILITQYRYNLKLYSYYLARADVLRFTNDDKQIENFEKLCLSLTPSFDFGKDSSTHIDQFIEIAKLIKNKSDG